MSAHSIVLPLDCGHTVAAGLGEYGDGSLWCEDCKAFQTYGRCDGCGGLSCSCVREIPEFSPGGAARTPDGSAVPGKDLL